MKFLSLHSRACFRGGFSLVELSLALGIASFALVLLMGLLASGLGQAQSNQDRFIHTQITNWVDGTLRHQGAATPGAARFYFDKMGLPSTTPAGAIFAARIEPRTILLPGASSHLEAWTVEVSSSVRNGQTLGEKVVWAEGR